MKLETGQDVFYVVKYSGVYVVDEGKVISAGESICIYNLGEGVEFIDPDHVRTDEERANLLCDKLNMSIA